MRAPARAAIVSGVAVLAYVGSIPSGFVFDDRPVIYENPVIRGIVPVDQLPLRDWFALSAAQTIGSYRPLATLAFWADWRVSGGDPHYFHALNVLAHGLAVALVYLVFRGIVGEWPAFLGALLAAVLVAPSEVIEGAIGRADLFETIGIVGGLWAHRRRGALSAALAAVAFGLAWGSKESGILAVAAWGMLDILAPGDVPLRQRLGRWLGYGCVAAGYLALRQAALGTLRLPTNTEFYNPLVGVGPVRRIFGAAHIFVERYLLGILDPRRRLYDCSTAACAPSDPGDPVAWLGLVIAGALVVIPVVLRRRRPVIAIGLAWFACFFLPVSNLIVTATLSYGERLLYIPCIGLCLAVAAGVLSLAQRMPRAAWALYGAIALINLSTLQVRHLDWRDMKSLYRSGLEYGGNSATVLEQNAAMSNLDGHFQEAEDFARRSIAIAPNRPYALTDLGVALDGEGRLAEAEDAFERGIEAHVISDSIGEYATFLARHGRFQEALGVVERYKPALPDAPGLAELEQKLRRVLVDRPH